MHGLVYVHYNTMIEWNVYNNNYIYLHTHTQNYMYLHIHLYIYPYIVNSTLYTCSEINMSRQNVTPPSWQGNVGKK